MGNVLQIGATVDIAPLKEAMVDAAGSVRSQAGSMSEAFQQLAAESRASTEEIASNWVNVAQASLALKAAQSDVRSATLAAKEAEEGDTAALARLALAKRDAAIASEAQAAAIKAATVAGVEEEGMLAGLTERLVGTAEASKLAEGSMAGFAGIAGLLGGGLLLGFFAHFEDGVAKSLMALRNLHLQTLISVESLAGLKHMAEALDTPFEAVANGLIKMQKAQQLAREGSQGAVQAFARIGITVQELKALEPEELFYRIAQAVRTSGSTAANAASDIGIFGKGGAALIPIFISAGDSIREMVKEAAIASGVTTKATDAAAKWTAGMAELKEYASRLGATLLTVIVPAVRVVAFGFEALGAIVATVAQAIASAAAVAVHSLVGLAKVAMDVASRNFGEAVIDAAEAEKSIVAIWKTGSTEIEDYWRRMGSEWEKLKASFEDKGEGKGGPNLPKPAAPKEGKLVPDHTFDIEVKAEEAHALAMLEIERKRYESEAKLRGDSALQVEAQLLAFNDRELRIKQNAIAELKALQGDENTADRQARLAAEGAAAEDHAAEKRVEINDRANERIVADSKKAELAKENLLHQLGEAQAREFAVESAEARKELQERERDMREELSFATEMNNRQLETTLRMDNDRLKHHQMTARQWEDAEIEAVRQWQAQAIAILEKEAAQELAIQGRQTTEYKRIKDREVQITQQAADRIAQIQQQEYDKFSQMFERMGTLLTRDLGQWLGRHETFGRAMIQVYDQMVTSIIGNLVKWGAEELAAMLTHKAIAKSGILSDAGSAGASAFRWVMNEVPFPVNAILAPIAAAGAFAGVMAFGSFEHGGVVPINAHPGEMVLPRHVSNWVLKAAGEGSGGGSSRGGGHTFHVNYQPVINHPVTRDDLRAHADFLFGEMRVRANAFNNS